MLLQKQSEAFVEYLKCKNRAAAIKQSYLDDTYGPPIKPPVYMRLFGARTVQPPSRITQLHLAKRDPERMELISDALWHQREIDMYGNLAQTEMLRAMAMEEGA
jgi:hypothetical protein